MHIEIAPRRPLAEDGPVVTIRVDEDALNELRKRLDKHDGELREIYADVPESNEPFTFERETKDTTFDLEGNTVPLMETYRVPSFEVTLPQGERRAFVTILRDIGAGKTADQLAEILEA